MYIQLDFGEIIAVLKHEYIMQNQTFKIKYNLKLKNLKIIHFPLVAGFFGLYLVLLLDPPSPVTFFRSKSLQSIHIDDVESLKNCKRWWMTLVFGRDHPRGGWFQASLSYNQRAPFPLNIMHNSPR